MTAVDLRPGDRLCLNALVAKSLLPTALAAVLAATAGEVRSSVVSWAMRSPAFREPLWGSVGQPGMLGAEQRLNQGREPIDKTAFISSSFNRSSAGSCRRCGRSICP